MDIGVDIRSLLAMSRGGIPHYTLATLRELIRQHPDDTWKLLQTGRRPYRLPRELAGPNVQLHHVRVPNRVLNARLAATGHPRLDRVVGGVDVWFSPGFGFLSLSRDVPVVLTVHDLSFDAHPEWYGWRSRAWHQVVRPRATARRASRLIAVSKQTRDELTGRYRIPSSRVRVIHPGVDDRFRKSVSPAARRRVRRKYALSDPYLLYIGAVERRKNLVGLLEAYQAARVTGLDSELVLVGRATRQWRGPLRLLEGVRRLGFVPDDDMPALYAEARELALLSWYEGFGFPPLEALACGTPSLVSDIPIFRETLGSAALRADPGNPEAIADSLVRLDRDTRLRKRLVDAGAARLPRFAWPRSAEETYRVLTEAVHAR